jgi:CubicO group peptidase (beta-lactamase class C family)
MPHIKLSEFVEATTKKFKIPGVAVGVWASGKEAYACHGVTSVDNPLPIDQDTLFLVASVTKTFTATTLMHLVAEGKVELNAPVRRYIPELQLKDKQAADKVTVLNLLNHTAGFDWRVNADTGEGDDALERYVAKMAELKLIAPLGTRVSYSQAGYNLLGRIIEKVTGQTFEQAVDSLVFEPLGLSHSFFARDDIMTRRFAVGHNRGEEELLSIARPWRHSRGDNPGGGLASSVAELLRWARFHLGDGRAASGTGCSPPTCCSRCRSPRLRCERAPWATPLASAGSCAT